MKTANIHIRMHNSETVDGTPVVLLDRQLMTKWAITGNQAIQLSLGSSQANVIVRPVNSPGTLSIPANLFSGVHAMPSHRLRLRYAEKELKLRIGPLVALLLQGTYRSPSGLFGEMTPFTRELQQAARREGVWLVVITPQTARTDQSGMSAYVLQKQWRRVRVPLPDVIYNRLQTRKAEQSKAALKLFRLVQEHFSTAIFNEQFLDKITVFKALGREEPVRTYLPQTLPINGPSAIRQMSEQHSLFFVKPTNGSMGRGIIRVTKYPDGSFVSVSEHTRGTMKRSHADSLQLSRHLLRRTRNAPHLVQQGLRLLTVNRRNVDYRALVQKDRRGQWAITSIVARVAGAGHFVSNLARGGLLMSVPQSLRLAKVGAVRGGQLHKELRRIALLIADATDKQMNRSLGELGIDLAIDRQLRIWLLEVNSKPSKTDPQLPGAAKVRPSARKAIEYARFLSKF